MSFSRDVRNQLTQLPIEKACCRQAQLLALTIVSASEAHTLDRLPHLVFTLDNAAVARHLFKLGKAVFGTAPLLDFHLSRPAERHAVYQVAMPVKGNGMVAAMLTADELQDAIARKPCCRRSFLRGIFMGCGSLVSPSKAYHLEFNATEDVCHWIVEVLEREEVRARCYHRAASSDQWTVYIKDASEIAKYLTLIGAHSALLRLEEVRIGKDLVNNVQRVVNCETANLGRTIRTAERQARMFEWLDAHGGLTALPPDWRAVALARLEMPFASLQELGSALEPPMSKSAVNHRLRLLQQLYVAHGGPNMDGPEQAEVT